MVDPACLWLPCGPQFITDVAAQFSNDTVVIAAGTELRLHSVKTADRIVTIDAHANKITCMIMHNGRCITGSLDGIINIWDLEARACIDKINVGQSVIRLQANDTYIFVVVSDSDSFYIVSINRLSTAKKIVLKTPKPISSLAMRLDGQVLAATSTNTLFIMNEAGSIITHRHNKVLLAACFNPIDDVVCTSDVMGQIVLWFGYQHPRKRRNLGKTNSKTKKGAKPSICCVTSVLHWHARSFQALQFTDDGAYLLSGGQERVLVQWQMHDGHKQFLPRMGGEIKAISVSPRGDMYAINCDDNSIKIVSAISSRVVSTIRGVMAMAPAHDMPASPAYQIALDRRLHGHIVLSVTGSTRLQFYDSIHDRNVAIIELDPMSVNRGSVSEVSTWSMSHDGRWIAVALRSDRSLLSNALSFYECKDASSRFQPRVHVADPDQTGHVRFHPSAEVCVSLGPTEVRIWAPITSSEKLSWAIQVSGSYRSLCPKTTAFSRDGSILAVLFEGSIVTLWDPMTMTLLHEIYNFPDLKHIGFTARHVIGASGSTVFAWDIVEAQPIWSSPTEAIDLACAAQFVAVATANSVLIFSPENASPVFIKALENIVGFTLLNDDDIVAITAPGLLYRLPFRSSSSSAPLSNPTTTSLI